MKQPTTISAYIAAAPKPAQLMMKRLRAEILAVAPMVTEKISYGMPFFQYKKEGFLGRLVYFGAFKNHVSIFAWGREVDAFPELAKYKTSKGTLQFPLGTTIPSTLVRKVVKARMKALDVLQATATKK
jgi:uncharacterized protein YdhG (YjbR/CyaY superfamily)